MMLPNIGRQNFHRTVCGSPTVRSLFSVLCAFFMFSVFIGFLILSEMVLSGIKKWFTVQSFHIIIRKRRYEKYIFYILVI